MLKEFVKIYNLPENSVFKRVELEDVLIEKFGELKYSRLKGWTNKSTGEVYPDTYWASAKEKWGLYEISTDYHGANPTEALIGLFVKQGVEPKEGTEEYYTENYCKEFHEIVSKVYKDC